MAKIDEYLKVIAESVGESPNITSESDGGKKYDWSKDFRFTPEVVDDLKNRHFFGLGAHGILTMVPIKRENAPVSGSGEHEEPFDILHIEIDTVPKTGTLEISRFYGHRTDWTGEGHDQDHIDWTDIPVLSDDTVRSLIDAYKSRNVFQNFLEKKKVEAGTFYNVIANHIQPFIDGTYQDYEWKWDYPENPSPELIAKRAEEHGEKVRKTDAALTDFYDKMHDTSFRRARYTGD